MSGHAAHVITVGPPGIDDAAARAVTVAIQTEGMPVAARQVVDDDETRVEPLLATAMSASGLVAILDPPGGSGGEIIRRVLARLAGLRLVLNDRMLALLEEDCARRGRAMPRRFDRLGLLPQGALLWPAADGPPAFALETSGTAVVVLPLHAASLGAIVDERLRPLVRKRIGSDVTMLRTLRATGVSAAEAEERLGGWLGRRGPVAASTVLCDGDVWVRLAVRGISARLAERDLESAERAIREVLGDDCYGRDAETLESVCSRLLVDRGLTVSVAESCTGGLLAQRLTSVAGASRFFDRGVIAYGNRALERSLGIPAALIADHGAVSRAVAEAMAVAVARIAGSACGLAVTGIAGPDGGTVTKPVGTVFAACAVVADSGPPVVEARHHRLAGDRAAIAGKAAQAALDLLRRTTGARRPGSPAGAGA
jgi:nicotinamide-nucleotide amidase